VLKKEVFVDELSLDYQQLVLKTANHHQLEKF